MVTDEIKIANQMTCWGYYPGLSEWAQYSLKSIYKWKRENQRDGSVRRTWPGITGF